MSFLSSLISSRKSWCYEWSLRNMKDVMQFQASVLLAVFSKLPDMVSNKAEIKIHLLKEKKKMYASMCWLQDCLFVYETYTLGNSSAYYMLILVFENCCKIFIEHLQKIKNLKRRNTRSTLSIHINIYLYLFSIIYGK